MVPCPSGGGGGGGGSDPLFAPSTEKGLCPPPNLPPTTTSLPSTLLYLFPQSLFLCPAPESGVGRGGGVGGGGQPLPHFFMGGGETGGALASSAFSPLPPNPPIKTDDF